MYVYTCEPDFGSMMTCIYTAWEKALKVGHDQVRLETEPVEQLTLFEDYVHVAYDADKEEIDLRQNFDDELGFSQSDDKAFVNVNDADSAEGYSLEDEQGNPIFEEESEDDGIDEESLFENENAFEADDYFDEE